MSAPLGKILATPMVENPTLPRGSTSLQNRPLALFVQKFPAHSRWRFRRLFCCDVLYW